MPDSLVFFEAVLEPGGPSFMPMPIAIVPRSVVEALGGPAIRRVVGQLNGHPIRLGLQPIRTGERYLMLNKELCKTAGVQLGQCVHFHLAPDPTPEYIELPAELEEGLAAWPEAQESFEKLTGSMKRAVANHITEAKRTETRTARIMQLLERLVRGGHPFRKL
ncbi:YdeI/OmpD-associated family protein [Hymenobacter sp. AT01-02]|uniref:YdeI/OmpD-associated family protein n=1 Tax=Hymenobacter sp. AT01-02 TaxID=1571877 RepID=UPI0005F148D8|nr:YdeI/OmpD-associated family protein [Hymenobacter sp. AT01-02]